MPTLNVTATRDHLQKFDFARLFIEELGWNQPGSHRTDIFEVDGVEYAQKHIAQLSGIAVIEITAKGGSIPDAKSRLKIHKHISQAHHENVLIFVDKSRSQSMWYWVKREGNKLHPRDHYYFRGQPGDLFLSKLAAMAVDISELDDKGHLPLTDAARRLKNALDVERVTKKFYGEYDLQRLDFVNLIKGIDDEKDRRWYASVLLNRLMFVYFLQRKGFVDGQNMEYLQQKLNESKKHGEDRFYPEFLKTLFFEGFAKPKEARSDKANKLLGDIKYLNGGLFIPHQLETANPNITVPDVAFENLFALFARYSWNLNDAPGGADNEINPDVLGYIFEKYINQKAFGAYYTRPEITEYLCESAIYKLILDRVKPVRSFDSIEELLFKLDARLCGKLLDDILPSLSLLDPACGSGAFLVAAMKTLIKLYSAIIGKIEFLNDNNLNHWLRKAKAEHKSLSYFIKKRIITDNLYGVDIMEEATEIAKLRLFLALVASAETVDDLEPLPNIDFNIMAGNSLVGMMRVDEHEFDSRTKQGNMFRKSYREILEEKNRLIDTFRHSAKFTDDLRALRDTIDEKKKEAVGTLDGILLEEFSALKIKFEQATWDEKKVAEGKPVKRPVNIADVETLHPFHWGFEFDEIINKRGGFDAIITNPPWEIFKPQAKEFFAEHSGLVTKNKMTIKEFEKEQAKLLKDPEIREAWMDYQNRFPHVSAYFRSATQFKNQIAVVNGKKAGTDINLYKLFLEQCFNLLAEGGYCGIVIPSGIYTDLGTKQLREMLFTNTEITGLFGFENRKEIFESVDSRFKFVTLTFEKGGATQKFPTAFMRHNVAELASFPKDGALWLSVEMVRRLSPDSVSIMEFKSDMDIHIAEKMLKFPLLGEKIEGKWNLKLCNEFHMTNDSHLFKTEPGNGRLPLYEGKMIHQFTHEWGQPKYWIDEKEGRKALLGREKENGQTLDYQEYRLGFRDIASNTNERTMISSVIPQTFHGNKIPTVTPFSEEGARIISNAEQLFVCAIWNSFVIDAMLRMKVTTTLNFFYVYSLPVPRLTESDPQFAPIVERAGRLICTTPEYDDLAKAVGLGSHKKGVTDPTQRARLRAELDGMIAHLYGLTEKEFTHILATFPLVPADVKADALECFKRR